MLQRELDNFVAGRNQQFVLVVKDHPERRALRFEDCQIATIGIKDLDAFDIAHEDAAFAVHSDCMTSPKLTWLIARTAKAIEKLSVGIELENGIAERPERVNVSEAIDRDARVQL